MKKNLFFGLLVACALLSLNSCKKEYLVDVVGKVSGNVKTYDNSYIEKVLVTVEGTEISDSTDADGYYELNGLSSGSSTLVFTKNGYTKARVLVNIAQPNIVANTTSGNKQSYTYSTVTNTILYPLIGTAKGYVYFNGAAVANAKVYAYPSSLLSIDQAYFSTTTSADGSYSFSNLALTSVASVSYSFVSYHPSITNVSGTATISDISAKSTAIITLTNDPLLYISNNVINNVVDTAGSITLTFSDNVSKAITDLKGGSVYLYDYTTSVNVGTVITYAANTISIKPVAGLTHGNTYYVSYNVFSTETKSVSGTTTSFKAAARTTITTTQPVLTTISDALSLTTATPGATGYDIYYISPSMSEYALLRANYSFSTNYSISAYATGTKFYCVPRVTSTTDGTNYYGTTSAVVTK